MTNVIHCIFIGIGSVGQNLIQILRKKREILKLHYNIHLAFHGAADSSGLIIDFHKELDLADILIAKKNKKSLQSYVAERSGQFFSNELDIASLIHSSEIFSQEHLSGKTVVLFEASPVNLKNGEPGLSICKAALSRGIHVVLANKGPLVLAFKELHQLARNNAAKILFSATVCGGLPIVNIGRYDMIGSQITLFRGVFNSTTNFILEEMANGRSFQDALKEAQERGIAETDPSLDIEGYDTANKLLILSYSILRGFSGTIKDISVQGITHITTEMIEEAKKQNKVYKLVATATLVDTSYKLSVEPTLLEKKDFLSQCEGWEMGVEIHSDLYGIMYHKLYEREPIPTAASMVRDAVNIVLNSDRSNAAFVF